MKKIFMLVNKVVTGYDTYDSCIVVADNADVARTLSPCSFYYWDGSRWCFEFVDGSMGRSENISSWCNPDEVEVNLIGITDLYNEDKVLLASFNAG